MDRLIYTALSGATQTLQEQQISANNLANVNTNGFRADMAMASNDKVKGGGFDTQQQQKPTRAPIQLESKNGLKNDAYTIAMARTANPHTATAQFFINVKDNANLNAPQPDGYGYTVFGKVVQGMDVVDKIRAVATGNRGMHQNVPTQPIIIQSVKVLSDK